MFDIGFWELLIIGTVALLVVGPDRLPGLATFLGHWVGRARNFANHMRNEIQQELEAEHLKTLVDEQQKELNSLRQEVEGVRDDAQSAVREVEREAQRDQAASTTGAVARDDDPAAISPAEQGTASADASAPAQDAAGEPATDAGSGQAAPKSDTAKKGSARKTARKKSGARKKATSKTSAAATGVDETGSASRDADGSTPQGEER